MPCRHVTAILENQIWQKLYTNLDRYISISTDIDEKRFVVFEHAIGPPFFVYVHSFRLGNCFSFFAFLLFSLFLSFLLFFFLHLTFKQRNSERPNCDRK